MILSSLALPLLILLYVSLLWWMRPDTPGREVRLDQFPVLVARDGEIRDATILDADGRLVGHLRDGSPYWVALPKDVPDLVSDLVTAMRNTALPVRVQQQPLKSAVGPLASSLMPTLVVVDGLLLIFLLFSPGRDGFSAFGRARARRTETDGSPIMFEDVAGVDEAVEELGEIREYLANPERFRAIGATVPKGVLLTGPPGCGKTRLAQALAGESHVPFFPISGSDFVEMLVGVGAARIRDFFATAKAAAPSIVFIDELDAVGRARTVQALGGRDEREATLNQLLVEMDGFESGGGVVVVAATNRPDIIDPALLRPGRFDRRIVVERPDLRGRLAILGVHSRNKALSPALSLEGVARRTSGFSGADLAGVVNEAALLAARRGVAVIEPAHLFEAIERVLAGPERRSRILSVEDRRRAAWHEAGHAVVASTLPGHDPVTKLSIVARGHALGFTWFVPESDQASVTRSNLLDRLAALLAGRAAEELVMGEASSGAARDIEMATSLARRMIAEFGLSERVRLMSVQLPAPGAAGEGSVPQCSERVLSEIDAEVQEVLERAHAHAAAILAGRRKALDRVAEALLERETLEGDRLEELLVSSVEEVRGAVAPSRDGSDDLVQRAPG